MKRATLLLLLCAASACGSSDDQAPQTTNNNAGTNNAGTNNATNTSNIDPNNMTTPNADPNNAVDFDGVSGSFTLEFTQAVANDAGEFGPGEYQLEISPSGDVSGDICTMSAADYIGMNTWDELNNEQKLLVQLDGSGRINRVRYWPTSGLSGEYQFRLASPADSVAEIAGDYEFTVAAAPSDAYAVGDTVSLSISSEGEVSGDLAFASTDRPASAPAEDLAGDFNWQLLEGARMTQLRLSFDVASGDLDGAVIRIIEGGGMFDYELEQL